MGQILYTVPEQLCCVIEIDNYINLIVVLKEILA